MISLCIQNIATKSSLPHSAGASACATHARLGGCFGLLEACDYLDRLPFIWWNHKAEGPKPSHTLLCYRVLYFCMGSAFFSMNVLGSNNISNSELGIFNSKSCNTTLFVWIYQTFFRTTVSCVSFKLGKGMQQFLSFSCIRSFYTARIFLSSIISFFGKFPM